MAGIAEIALAGAPLAGGALLGLAAGNMRAPDIRAWMGSDIHEGKLLSGEYLILCEKPAIFTYIS